MLRWHLRDTAIPVMQVNERRRFVGFAAPKLDAAAGLYVGAKGDPDAALLASTPARLQMVGEAALLWRCVIYDRYVFQTLSGWLPVLNPPPGDPFERARPH
ncbi:hypothetical protein [Bradyrhizobium oligotrophicum]|uniref:hypothetical protein n=1 Tax=Bradyrhizobium oligotrophicum TaxID=44255 RepID=UPI003EB864C7